MKKSILLFAMALFLVIACEQDELPLTTVNTVSDVTANAEYTTCSVTCSNESVDGNNVKMRLLLSDEESLKEYSVYEMNVTEPSNLKCELQELEQGKKYYFGFELYTENESYRIDTTYYFETKPFSAPIVSTDIVSDITPTSALCGGNVISDGGMTVGERGICWGISANPTISGQHLQCGTGTGHFNASLSSLDSGMTYFVRAYAINQNGIAYGDNVSFVPKASAPYVSTGVVTNITSNSAMCEGVVAADGGSTVTVRGVCWSTSQDPTTASSHSTESGTIGSFVSHITGLSVGTTYYVRAYACNAIGTSYGIQQTFTTLGIVPDVSIGNVTNITSSSASCTGCVNNDGGSTITARGLCWSTSQNPTVSNSHSTVSGTTGTFTSQMTGLSSNTTYYVRAYATNAYGTSYSTQQTFTTLGSVPSVTTGNVTNITSNSATCTGNVTSSGGSTITARGLCWSTSQNPTVSNSHSTLSGATGSFSSNMTGLSSGTTYYVRAYATNANGTGYGAQKTFVTASNSPNVNISVVTVTWPQSNIPNEVCFEATVSGDNVSECGFVYSYQNTMPVIGASNCIDYCRRYGAGTFTFCMCKFESSTGYVRAYAKIGSDYYYGPVATY